VTMCNWLYPVFITLIKMLTKETQLFSIFSFVTNKITVLIYPDLLCRKMFHRDGLTGFHCIWCSTAQRDIRLFPLLYI